MTFIITQGLGSLFIITDGYSGHLAARGSFILTQGYGTLSLVSQGFGA